MLCFGRRLRSDKASDGDVLIIRSIWEWHWAIASLFVGVAVVMFFGVGWVWQTPGETNTWKHRLWLSLGAVLSLGCGAVFLWAARSDQLILDRTNNRWRFVRRTFPWECSVLESGLHPASLGGGASTAADELNSGSLASITAVFATTRSRRELELAVLSGSGVTSNASGAEDRRSLLSDSDRSADAKTPATSRAAAPAATAAAAVDEGPNPNVSCHCGSSTVRSGGNRSNGCCGSGGCGARVLCIRVQSASGDSALTVPLIEGQSASCTALCCCSDRAGYLDIDSTVCEVSSFLGLNK